MKRIILFAAILLATITFAQTSYELKPGTKGNQIVIQLVNTSQTELSLSRPILLKDFKNLEFENQTEEMITLAAGEEKDIVYTFDVKYDSDISSVDTVEFLISDAKTVNQTKQFILSYAAPTEYSLSQNYPNPFNPTTKIRYSIPRDVKGEKQEVKLVVYDILGKEVVTLVNEEQTAGNYEVEFNGKNLASGVYIYRIQASEYVNSKKIILLK
jgi:hypothetical protein